MDQIDLTLRKEFWDARPPNLTFNDTLDYRHKFGYEPFFENLTIHFRYLKFIVPDVDPDHMVTSSSRNEEDSLLTDWEFQYSLLGKCDEFKWYWESNYGYISHPDDVKCDCCGNSIYYALNDSKSMFLCDICDNWDDPDKRIPEFI